MLMANAADIQRAAEHIDATKLTDGNWAHYASETSRWYVVSADELEHELPTRREVCPGCDGHGTRLCDGMRGHAYTAEEFEESFDDEQAEEYFKHGGRYDVTCSECQGERVIDAVDEDACVSDEDKATLALYHTKLDAEHRDRMEEEYERRLGC